MNGCARPFNRLGNNAAFLSGLRSHRTPSCELRSTKSVSRAKVFDMETVTIFNPTDVLLRLGAATLIGCVLGINRELRHKPAGLRTHALVALGAATVTLAALRLSFDGKEFDRRTAAPIIQGIITGIGFLGAGVILRDTAGHVQGLTTAASIWVAACLGVSSGIGFWWESAIALALTMLILVTGGAVEKRAHALFHDDEESKPEP